jgi:uncharacterized membrane protein (UPF0127 family)
MRKLGTLWLFFAITITACTAKDAVKFTKQDIAIIKSDGDVVALRVEVARSPEQHSRGFMERRNILDGTGMLFIFERDQQLSFWMKNTPTALSIAYIDAKFVIREIHDMTPHSLAPIQSATSLRYALEVPQGWFARSGVQVGDRLRLE